MPRGQPSSGAEYDPRRLRHVSRGAFKVGRRASHIASRRGQSYRRRCNGYGRSRTSAFRVIIRRLRRIFPMGRV